MCPFPSVRVLVAALSISFGPRIIGAEVAAFPRVTRGAYLQSGTSTSIVIRWRTAVATSTVVRYGLRADNLDRKTSSPGRSREHLVLLENLTPGRRYYYAIGTADRVLQGGTGNYFMTSPESNSTQPTRVWALGDPGTGYPVQKAVRDAYARTTGAVHTDLVITLGDNAYSRGTEFQYDNRFFDVYRDQLKRSVLWPSLGNHDIRSADSVTESGAYFRLFTLPRLGQAGGVASGSQAYYSFDYGNAHFVCLNSCSDNFSTNGPMVRWLTADLAANQKDWTVAFWHHPPYSKGSHDSDSGTGDDARMTVMREVFLPVLEQRGVDIVLCGHSHLYERSFLLGGHYGTSQSLVPRMILNGGDGCAWGDGPYIKQSPTSMTAPGTVYVNAGSSGHATKACHLQGLNHPAMCCSMNVPGSFVLDIRGLRLDGSFLDARGRQRDQFTILKTREVSRPEINVQGDQDGDGSDARRSASRWD